MAKHHILGGSLEVEGKTVTAGVHVGPSEWVPTNLRYIQAEISNMIKGETLGEFMGRIYENSTGCLIKGTFQLNQLA